MLQIPLSAIRPKYRHLYYQDGPVKPEHLTAAIAAAAKKSHSRVMLVGLAPAPPPDFGPELNAALSKGTDHGVDHQPRPNPDTA